MSVQVQGRDAGAEAYRIATRAGRALVPEHLMAALRPGARPSHQEAYEWIAAHARALEEAVDALAANATPKRPYDSLTLIAPDPSSGQ